jgi:hypothetical protein
MIWTSEKTIIKNMLLTLNARNLKFIGVDKFTVRDKKIIKLKDTELPQFLVLLSTETGMYESIITVSEKRYNQLRKGEFFGSCGIIKNIRHSDFTLLTENINSNSAIIQTVLKSWGKLIFIFIVMGLALLSLFLLLLPFLNNMK